MPDLPVQGIVHQINGHEVRLSVSGQKCHMVRGDINKKTKNTIVSKIKNEYVKLQNRISQQADRSEGMGAR